MTTSDEGLNLIKHYESLHDGDLKAIGLQPKMCPAGVWTEGWGRAMRDDKGVFIEGKENYHFALSRRTIHTLKEADEALKWDVQRFEMLVHRFINKRILKQNEFDALVSYWYNTGGSTTLANLINKNATEKEIRDWWNKHYITSNGVIQKGLILRRKTECELFFKK